MLEAGGAGGSYKGAAATRKTDSRNAVSGGLYSTKLGGLLSPKLSTINKTTGAPVGSGVLSSYGNAAPKTVSRAAVATSGGGGGSSSGGSGGGGGGGSSSGGAATAALAAPIVLPNINDYIKKSYLLNSTDQEADRKLDDFDAQTLAGRQDTEADMARRQVYLDQDLDNQGQANAESFASRGLDRSGLVFQAQDKIDAAGEKQRDSINQLLTDFTRGRTTARLTQQEANRQARAQAIQQLTDTYNTQYGVNATATAV